MAIIAAETRLKLSDWEFERRVVWVRWAVRQPWAVESKPVGKHCGQHSLQFANVDAGKRREFVLLSNSDCPLTAVGQLDGEHADCENGLDEEKSMWGWGGCATQHLER